MPLSREYGNRRPHAVDDPAGAGRSHHGREKASARTPSKWDHYPPQALGSSRNANGLPSITLEATEILTSSARI